MFQVQTIINPKFPPRQASARRKRKSGIVFRVFGDRSSGGEAQANGGQTLPQRSRARRAAGDGAVEGRAEEVAQHRVVFGQRLGELGDAAVADAVHELMHVAAAEELASEQALVEDGGGGAEVE